VNLEGDGCKFLLDSEYECRSNHSDGPIKKFVEYLQGVPLHLVPLDTGRYAPRDEVVAFCFCCPDIRLNVSSSGCQVRDAFLGPLVFVSGLLHEVNLLAQLLVQVR
jgi:hypothetical protein